MEKRELSNRFANGLSMVAIVAGGITIADAIHQSHPKDTGALEQPDPIESSGSYSDTIIAAKFHNHSRHADGMVTE